MEGECTMVVSHIIHPRQNIERYFYIRVKKVVQLKQNQFNKSDVCPEENVP